MNKFKVGDECRWEWRGERVEVVEVRGMREGERRYKVRSCQTVVVYESELKKARRKS